MSTKVTWDKLQQGDFFFVEYEEYGSLIYQKISEKNGYNAVLLNSGELCQIYTSSESNNLYNKVTVSFNIHSD